MDFLCLATHNMVTSQNKMERTHVQYLYPSECFDYKYTKLLPSDHNTLIYINAGPRLSE